MISGQSETIPDLELQKNEKTFGSIFLSEYLERSYNINDLANNILNFDCKVDCSFQIFLHKFTHPVFSPY